MSGADGPAALLAVEVLMPDPVFVPGRLLFLHLLLGRHSVSRVQKLPSSEIGPMFQWRGSSRNFRWKLLELVKLDSIATPTTVSSVLQCTL